MRHIGMTGTREGMTKLQSENFKSFITSMDLHTSSAVTTLHHGDCIGADTDAHNIATKHELETEIHPPIKDDVRAYNEGTRSHEPKGYFERNRDIVNSSDWMFGFPVTDFETPKGGTWYTINYAKKTKTPLTIIFPNGLTETHNVTPL